MSFGTSATELRKAAMFPMRQLELTPAELFRPTPATQELLRRLVADTLSIPRLTARLVSFSSMPAPPESELTLEDTRKTLVRCEDAASTLEGIFRHRIHSTAKRLCPELADDMTQEAWSALIDPASKDRGWTHWLIEQPCGLVAYTLRSSRLVMIDSLRKWMPQRYISLNENEQDPQGTADQALNREEADRILATLPDTFRKILIQFYLEDRSREELALLHSCTVATISNRLTKARKMARVAQDVLRKERKP